MTSTFQKNKSAGFTLVELLVIITILSILAAIAIPPLLSYIDQHKESQVVTACRSAVLTAESMYAQAYELGQKKPTSAAILAESGLSGQITSIEVNENIKDSSDIVLHLSYLEKGITVTYCRDYLKKVDDHKELYNIDDGVEYNDNENDTSNWEEIPVAPTEVEEEETETEEDAPVIDSGIYMPVGVEPNKKLFLITGNYQTYSEEQFEHFRKTTDWYNENSTGSAWFFLHTNQILYVGDNTDNATFYLVVDGPIDIHETKDGNVPSFPSHNTLIIDNSAYYNASDLFKAEEGWNGQWYGNWIVNDTFGNLLPGMIFYDDVCGTGNYYVYISAFHKPGDNINWLHGFSEHSAWRELTLYEASSS